ncbi:hypothetical protein ACSDR0_38845 [Streptosporangium sp. G11]|uniref:hypothetical protein n=1 Tax=Streptosporangium sp. G11 TaxID=3436926 RepID=UPI003EBAE5F3
MTSTSSPLAPWPKDVIIRFLNQGGATVDLYPVRFTTKWNYRGAPYAATHGYEVNGYSWSCLGCGVHARQGDTYNDPGYRDLSEARQSAQGHAEICRGIPRPADPQPEAAGSSPRRWFSRRKER